MKKLKIVRGDFIGLWRICGSSIAIKWLVLVVANFPRILRRKELLEADAAMGEGPFSVSLPRYHAIFTVMGRGAISGVREMYVRDAYLGGGLLQISDGQTVVDLGANIGNFTNLALAHGSLVRVVAVEPSAGLNCAFEQSVGQNPGYLERTTLIRAFVGQMGELQAGLKNWNENYMEAPWISEEELIKLGSLDKVDFLKCDIEGGEFGLLNSGSKPLAMTQSLAIEIHAFAGDVRAFLRELQSCGFNIILERWAPDGSVTALARRA